MGGVQPVWSAHGLQVATASGDIDVFTLADRIVVNLTNGAGLNGPPRWSPDNRRIAFASHDPDGDSSGTVITVPRQ